MQDIFLSVYVVFNRPNNPMKKILFPQFRDEEIEAQRGKVTYPGLPVGKLSQISKPGTFS